MAFPDFEITTRDEGENGIVDLGAHNAACAHAGLPPAGPDDWFGVILADHGLVATFCTYGLADQFLQTATA